MRGARHVPGAARDGRESERPPPVFRRVLIANRGEVAVRLVRACHELGVEAVAVYSTADRDAPYLRLAEDWALDLRLSVDVRPAGAAAVETVSRTSFAGLYWQVPQQIAHLTVNGAHLRTGDLLASGTVSGAERGTEGIAAWW